MGLELLEELLRSLYPSVTQEGEGEGGGGGGTPPASTSTAGGTGGAEDESVTIKKLRNDLKAAERKLAAVEGIDPDVFKSATKKADELEAQLKQRDAIEEAQRLRLEQKANEAVLAAKSEAETEKQRRIELQTETLAKASFEQAKGRVGADDEGRTYFDGFMSLVGKKHLRIDEQGKLYVVDAQGDAIPSPDGKGRIAPDAWMKSMADKSEVIGTFFQPTMGSGSGMGNSRSQGGRNLPALKDLNESQRRELAWNNAS